MSDQPAALGSHVYAGGFTVGVSRHFDVMAHLEHKAYGAEVVKLNFPSLPIIEGGPACWPKPHSWKRRPRFFYANPPCAIWSQSSFGRTVHWTDDPRLGIHNEVVDYGLACEPDVLAVESVTGMFTAGRSHVDELAKRADRVGYSTTVVLHDAKFLGVAQSRRRAFMVFHRVAIPWEEVDTTRPPTVREALKRANKRAPSYDTTISPMFRELVARCAPGQPLREVYDELYPGQTKGRPSFLVRKWPLDSPGYVVMSGKPLHPTELRFMNQAELAELCSFPPDYRWPAKNFAEISGYMSRGVMPKVGEWLARQVRAALDQNRRLNSTSYQVHDVRRSPTADYEITDEPPPPQLTDRRVYDMATKPGAAVPLRGDGEGSGAYIRRLLNHGYDPDTILTAVHDQFPGSKAGKSDIAWNRAKLAKETQAANVSLGRVPAEPQAAPARRAAPVERQAPAAPPPAARRGPARSPAPPADLPWEEEAPQPSAEPASELPESAVGRAVIKALRTAGYTLTFTNKG